MCEALPPTLERIVRIYLHWYLGIEALRCKNYPFWGTYSDQGKGTSGTGGPHVRRIFILWDLVGGPLGCHVGYIGQPGCRLGALLVPWGWLYARFGVPKYRYFGGPGMAKV